jgi:uncharacterized protein with ParB-like and HNH nuclease domain
MELVQIDSEEERHKNIIEDGTGVEVEEIESDEPITSPFDPSLIRVDTKPMTIDLLISRMQEKEINLAPDFQRRSGIWTNGAQSRLIESLLIRIPLPAFYFDATNDEKWLVVDGLQRLTTLKRFVSDKKLTLNKLEFLTEYEGKTYDELPRNMQRRINETQITVYLIQKGTPPKVKFTLFKRINTGGLPLSTMEIRHALNQGEASKLLVKLSQSKVFKMATDNSIRDERMADRECALRFLAFAMTHYSEYKEDLDTFLNDAMESINKLPKRGLKKLEERFLRAMKGAADIFGRQAFRRPSQRGNRSPISKALFEVWSVNLDNLTDIQLSRLIQRKETLIKKFQILAKDGSEFDNSISFSTGVRRKVNVRFSKVEELIKEVLQ